jgi:hypothetical protein
LQLTQLVYAGVDNKICFGLIGTKRFCWSKSHRIKAHKNKNNKFVMGTKGGWFLVGKGNLAGQPSAFLCSCLDALKITKNTALTLKNAFVDRCTTAEWEDFIFEAQEEWDSVEAQTLENIQESSLGDDDVDDDSDDLIKGDLALSAPPKIFEWTNKLEGLDGTLKTKLDEMNPKNTKEAVEGLHAAFGDLEGMVVDARRSLRDNAIEVLNHAGSSVA